MHQGMQQLLQRLPGRDAHLLSAHGPSCLLAGERCVLLPHFFGTMNVLEITQLNQICISHHICTMSVDSELKIFVCQLVER